MVRIYVEPLLQDVVRRELRKLFDDRGMVHPIRADQHTVPLPPACLSWFNQYHHLAAEQVDGQSAEHPLRQEAGVVLEALKNPLVVEPFHNHYQS